MNTHIDYTEKLFSNVIPGGYNVSVVAEASMRADADRVLSVSERGPKLTVRLSRTHGGDTFEMNFANVEGLRRLADALDHATDLADQPLIVALPEPTATVSERLRGIADEVDTVDKVVFGD